MVRIRTLRAFGRHFRMMAQRAFGLLCMICILAGCASFSANTATQATSTAFPTLPPPRTATPVPPLALPASYSQSPHLENLVYANVLPPVKERLPENPKVVQPVDQIGTYGGTWRMVLRGSADDEQFLRTVLYEPLVRWNLDWSGIEPNLAESYSVNASATEYSFTLRRGTRWSDGVPFTTQDIRFWYEDVLLNISLTPMLPLWLSSHSDPARFEFLDDYHFRVIFTYPNSQFLEQLASPDGLLLTAYPAHYARQFHNRYAAADVLDKRVRDAGVSSWTDLFQQKFGINVTDHSQFIDPNRPRLSAWTPIDVYGTTTGKIIWERNPYYWKVDPAGKQLPYIDTVQFNLVNNSDEVLQRVMSGSIDMQNLNLLGVDVTKVLGNNTAEHQNALYRYYHLEDGTNNVMAIHFNLLSTDSVKQKIFQNKNFRIGMSYAINRQEILQAIYQGQGTPWQNAPRQGSVFYDPLMASEYTEYNLDKANEYLDMAGYSKDTLGNRMGPTGEPISFSVEVLESEPQQIAMLNLVAKFWKAIGIDMQPKIDPLPIFLATIQSNSHDAAVSRGGSTYYFDVMLNPSSYLPVNTQSYWAIPWVYRYNRVPGYQAIVVDDSLQTAMRMYDRIRSVTNINSQVTWMKGALLVARESFWTMGIGLGPDLVGIVRRNFHNVPAQMPASWIYPDPGPANPEQFFMTPD